MFPLFFWTVFDLSVLPQFSTHSKLTKTFLRFFLKSPSLFQSCEVVFYSVFDEDAAVVLAVVQLILFFVFRLCERRLQFLVWKNTALLGSFRSRSSAWTVSLLFVGSIFRFCLPHLRPMHSSGADLWGPFCSLVGSWAPGVPLLLPAVSPWWSSSSCLSTLGPVQDLGYNPV